MATQHTPTTDTCTDRGVFARRRLRGGLFASAAAILLITLAPVVPSQAAGTGDIVGKLTAKKKKYLENAVVYISKVGAKPKPPAKPVVMDQHSHKFVPAVLPVVVGTTVRFINSDPEAHNVFSPDGKYDLGNWTKGEHRDHTFDKEGVFTQLCHLHPTMIGYVLVLQNPYFATVGADGSSRIQGVPPGTYQLEVWQERGGSKPTKVTVKSGGSSEVTIEMGKRRRK